MGDMCYKIETDDSSTFQQTEFRGACVDQLSADSQVLLLVGCNFITAYLPMANIEPKEAVAPLRFVRQIHKTKRAVIRLLLVCVKIYILFLILLILHLDNFLNRHSLIHNMFMHSFCHFILVMRL